LNYLITKEPIILYTDNLLNKINLKNGKTNSKLRHISVRYHFCKENIKKKKEIILKYCKSSNMLADSLTKDINGTKIDGISDKIFVKNNDQKK